MYINPFSNSFQSSQLSAVNSGICDVIQHVSLECNCVLSLKFSSCFFSYLFLFAAKNVFRYVRILWQQYVGRLRV